MSFLRGDEFYMNMETWLFDSDFCLCFSQPFKVGMAFSALVSSSAYSGPIMLIYSNIFIFLDSTIAALYYSLFKKKKNPYLPHTGPQFIHC